MEFKDIGKKSGTADTFYFNAFTEDLFQWENDLNDDLDRYMTFNRNSHFFDGFNELEMDNRIRRLLQYFADFDFRIDSEARTIRFSREVISGEGSTARSETVEGIKISRGEENTFLWCFFLAIAQLVLDDDDGAGPYGWVKYLYIDDPVSSLDDTNVIAIATLLSTMLANSNRAPKVIVSTHHGLFFNVLKNEHPTAGKYVLKKRSPDSENMEITSIGTQFMQHLITIAQLGGACRRDEIRRTHFNLLRSTMEQTAVFLGLRNWKACIDLPNDDPDRALCERMINVMSHGDYLVMEPEELASRYQEDFKRFFQRFVDAYPFSRTLLTIEDN